MAEWRRNYGESGSCAEGERDLLPQGVSLWQRDYFGLIRFERRQM